MRWVRTTFAELLADRQLQRIADRQTRERRIALVQAIGRLPFTDGRCVIDVSTADRREGLELLCKQQKWHIIFNGKQAIVQKAPIRTLESLTAA